MTAEPSALSAVVPDGASGDRAVRSRYDGLRRAVIALGFAWSAAFIVVGVGFGLQLYGDGSIFSYSVPIGAGWAYHFHNIAGRLFVFLYSHLPAEAYVAVTGDARGGIALYGLLFFGAPLVGLLATLAADRSAGRVLLGCACLSTAVLCPMVFGFPTEMSIAHSAFWPALALGHYARRGLVGLLLVFAAMLALALTHEGALGFAIAILATVALRGPRDPAFLRAAAALLGAVALWSIVKIELPPGDYYARIIPAAARNFIDVDNLFASGLVRLLAAALAAYAVALLLIRRLAPAHGPLVATALVALALAVYWLWFDHALHTQERYYVRTAILVVTPVIGGIAALCVLRAEGRLWLPVPVLARLAAILTDGAHALTRGAPARAAAGALALVTLVHAVETGKFVAAWTQYKAAVRALAMGTASDPALGDPRFVSSHRIDPGLNRLSWLTTTPFLSVLLAPGLVPQRLVVDPSAGYFWLSCEKATASERGDGAIPVESRRLIRVHACLHRQDL